MDLASDRYKRQQLDGPHFEMSVEEFLDQKRNRGMSKWLPPAIRTYPKPSPPKKGDDAEVRAHWEMLVKQAVDAKLKKK